MTSIKKRKSLTAALMGLLLLCTLNEQAHAALKCEASNTAAISNPTQPGASLLAVEDVPIIEDDQVFSPMVSGPEQQFGYSFSLNADTLAIGQWIDLPNQSGAVSLYLFRSGEWNLIKSITRLPQPGRSSLPSS